MNKTFTLMVASMFALVLVLSLGSAVSRDAINVTGNNSLINHGDSVVIKFKIDNQETQNISAIKLSLPTFSFGDWQTVKYDSKEYAISNDLVKIENIMIYGHDESKEFELTFKSKEYKKGSETKTLQIDAKNNGTNSYGLKVNPLSMNITIKDTPELTITDLPKLEKTSNGTITLSNKGNVDLTNMDFNQTSFGDFNVTFNNSNTKFGLTAGETKTFQVNSTNAKDLKIGKDNELDFEIISNELGNSNAFSITVPVDFCAYGNDPSGNDLKIDNFDITNLGSGDDNEWNRLDEIEIEVRIENEDDDDKI
ncbi:MAG: hypothetical protein U9Q99_00615, partial [Nanoarchaeota archaeon]|nr:hypothetical protein [Nanoarchaeota archaeon]